MQFNSEIKHLFINQWNPISQDMWIHSLTPTYYCEGHSTFSLKGELLKNSKSNNHPPNDFVHAWACFLHTSMFTLHSHYSIATISNIALPAAESFWTTKTTWSIIIARPSISQPALITKIHIFCKQEKNVSLATIWPLTVAILARNLNVSHGGAYNLAEPRPCLVKA